MKTFREYVVYRLVEDEMYTDKDVIQFMPGDVREKMLQITDQAERQNIVSQVKKELNQAYQNYTARKAPSPNVDLIWRKIALGGQQTTPEPMRGVARALGIDRPVGSMDLSNIENSIRSHLGNQESGLVKSLDLETKREIESMARKRTLIVFENAGKARMAGAGIHFYQSPQGLAFIRVQPGARPFSRPFGTY